MNEVTNQEQLPSSERFETAEQMVALHVRMALSGEALDSKNSSLPEVTDEQLVNFDQTVEAAANGSVVDRIDWWEIEWQKQVAEDQTLANLSEEAKAEKMYAIWEEGLTNDIKNDKNKDKIDRLKAKKIGGIDLNNFNAETVQQIYQRYFTGEKVIINQNGQEKDSTPSNIELFLDDVVAAYNYDYDKIVNDLEALKWYAGIFGTETEREKLLAATLLKQGKIPPKQGHADDAIKELIHLKIKLANEPKKQELITQAKETITIDGKQKSRHNWLNEKEEPILNWLHQASQLKRKTVPRQPVITEPKESTQKQIEADWDKLKAAMTPERWENAQQIRNIVVNSDVIKRGLPIYYPGSRSDIIYPLAFSDANNFVFVDFAYSDKDGNIYIEAFPDDQIKAIGGKILSTEIKRKLKQGGKRIIKFDWGGKTRTVTCYAEDATEFNPEELQGGSAMTILIGPSAPSDENQITAIDNIAKIYKNIAFGGFIHNGPTFCLTPEVVGFKKLINKPESDDVMDGYKNGWPLYQKVEDIPEDKLLQFLAFEKSAVESLGIRNGGHGFDESSYEVYEVYLKELRNFFDALPTADKQRIIPDMRKFFSDQVIPESLAVLETHNFTDPQQIQERWKRTAQIAKKIFPELEEKPPKLENIKKYYYDQAQALCANLRTRLRRSRHNGQKSSHRC